MQSDAPQTVTSLESLLSGDVWSYTVGPHPHYSWMVSYYKNHAYIGLKFCLYNWSAHRVGRQALKRMQNR